MSLAAPGRHPRGGGGGAFLGTSATKKKRDTSLRWYDGLLLLLALLFATPAFAQSALPPAPYANRQLDDSAQEAAARNLMLTIRCLTCQSQSIADSDASMAGDLRSQIRERIAAGEEPEAIRAWLITRYGDWISYEPTGDPILWPLWAAPVVLLGLGGWLMRSRLRRKRKRA